MYRATNRGRVSMSALIATLLVCIGGTCLSVSGSYAQDNWIQYEIQPLGLRLEYNEAWERRVLGEIVFFIIDHSTDPYTMMGVYKRTYDNLDRAFSKTVTSILKQQGTFKRFKLTREKVAGYDALRTSGLSTKAPGTYEFYVFINKDNVLYTLALTGVKDTKRKSLEKEFDRLVSSLSFLDQ